LKFSMGSIQGHGRGQQAYLTLSPIVCLFFFVKFSEAHPLQKLSRKNFPVNIFHRNLFFVSESLSCNFGEKNFDPTKFSDIEYLRKNQIFVRNPGYFRFYESPGSRRNRIFCL
jgi:hypothetical protein